MLHIDVFSGYVICGAGSLIGAGMMALARPNQQRAKSALEVCTFAFVLLGIGLFQFVLHETPPEWSLLWGAESAVLGTGLFGWGFSKLGNQRRQPFVLFAALAVASVVLALSQPYGLRVFALTLDLICLAIALSIVINQRNYVLRPRGPADLALGAGLAVYAVSWLWRAIAWWTYSGPARVDLLYVPEPWLTAFAIFYGVIPIIIGALVLNVVNAQLNEQLRERAATDELTGLLSRRALIDLSSATRHRAHVQGLKVALLMIDVDHFKRVNDKHGHGVGDEALQHVANLLAGSLRADAVLSRYGGEEFVVMLPIKDADSALHVAERMRANVEAKPLRFARGALNLTVSIGWSFWSDRELLPQAILRADAALYRAKANGRNRVELGEEMTSSGACLSAYAAPPPERRRLFGT